MAMKKIFLGPDPVTSILGYVIAAGVAIDELMAAGEERWWKLALVAAIAIHGRMSADSGKKQGNGKR